MEKLTAKQINRKLGYRWLCFFALSIVGLLVQFHRSSTGVIFDELTQTFNLSSTTYGLLSSMYFYPYVVMQLPNGILADKIGARKTVAFGGLLTVIGTILFAASQNYALLCFGRVLVGMGVSTQMVCMQKLSSSWFRSSEMATISGINSTIGSLGGLISQAPLALLVSVVSWRMTFAGLAVFSAVVYVVCYLLVRDTPHDKGLPTIEELEGSISPKQNKREKTSTGRAILNVVRNRNMWPMFIIMPVCMGAYTVFSGTWGVPYLREVYGLSNVEASTLTSYLMIGMFIGSFAAGFISDRIRSRKKVIVGICALVCFEWMMLVYGTGLLMSRALLTAVIFMFGFTASAVPVSLSTCREMNDRRYVGTAVGLSNMIGMSASAIFPTVCGSLNDRFGQLTGAELYRHTFGFIAILSCIALVIAVVFLKDTKCEYIEPNMGSVKK
ncbi:MAG: MFS transporter [Clostridia bacterium]|nr:MFS transporter [Clostridia bacterium]